MRATVERLQLSDVVKRVDTAQLKLQEAKQTLEREQQDKASLALVQAILTTGPLAHLKQSLLTLEHVNLFSTEGREIAARKETLLREEIARLTQFAQGLPQRLDAATDLQSS